MAGNIRKIIIFFVPVSGPDYQKIIGENIKNARKKLMWTQVDLEYYSEVPERTIQRIEDGKGNPGIKTLIKLVKALQIDPAELFHFAPGKKRK
jgi:transcriptional regulator with XRE-family HTH domain